MAKEPRLGRLLNRLKNRFLMIATNIGAMFVPGVNTVLGLEIVSVREWLALLAIAVSLFWMLEGYKLMRRRLSRQLPGQPIAGPWPRPIPKSLPLCN